MMHTQHTTMCFHILLQESITLWTPATLTGQVTLHLTREPNIIYRSIETALNLKVRKKNSTMHTHLLGMSLKDHLEF